MAKKKIKVSNPISSDDWQTRDDFRTICQAKEIEKDPKRMGKVRAFAKQQMMDAASIASDEENEGSE